MKRTESARAVMARRNASHDTSGNDRGGRFHWFRLQRSAVLPHDSPETMTSWNRGDRVVHAGYGSGTVLDVDEQHTIIHFDNAGRRTFATHLVVLAATGEAAHQPPATSLPPTARRSARTVEGSTRVGFRNVNGQTVLRQAHVSGNGAGEHVYVLSCGHCGREYAADGSDIHLRKCPSCMGGPPGLPY
jgi:hypothetical protein